ncbi:hypothetical protein Pmani_024109, partial [Petrolisthes manimaculis]
DVILSINGHDMEKSRPQTTGQLHPGLWGQMRMVVLFEDCVHKVELHIRYIQLQRLLQEKMTDLERLCHQEKSLLAGKLVTSPARHAYNIASARLLDWLRAQRRLLPPPRDLTCLLPPADLSSHHHHHTPHSPHPHHHHYHHNPMARDGEEREGGVGESNSVGKELIRSSSISSSSRVHTPPPQTEKTPLTCLKSLDSMMPFGGYHMPKSFSHTSTPSSYHTAVPSSFHTPTTPCQTTPTPGSYHSTTPTSFHHRSSYDSGIYSVVSPGAGLTHWGFNQQYSGDNYGYASLASNCSDSCCHTHTSRYDPRGWIQQQQQQSLYSHDRESRGRGLESRLVGKSRTETRKRGLSLSRKDSFRREELRQSNAGKITVRPKSVDKTSSPTDEESSIEKAKPLKMSKAYSISCMPGDQNTIYDSVVKELQNATAGIPVRSNSKKDKSSTKKEDKENEHVEEPKSPYEKLSLSGLETYEHSPRRLNKQPTVFNYSSSSLPHRRRAKTKKKRGESSSSSPKARMKSNSLDEDKLANLSSAGSDDGNKQKIEYGLEDEGDTASEVSSHVRPSELQLHQFFSLPYTSGRLTTSPPPDGDGGGGGGNTGSPMIVRGGSFHAPQRPNRQNSGERHWSLSQPARKTSGTDLPGFPRDSTSKSQRYTSCNSLCDTPYEKKDTSARTPPAAHMGRMESFKFSTQSLTTPYNTRECSRGSCSHSMKPWQGRMSGRPGSVDNRQEMSAECAGSFIMSRTLGGYGKNEEFGMGREDGGRRPREDRPESQQTSEVFGKKSEWNNIMAEKNRRKSTGGTLGRKEGGRETSEGKSPKGEESRNWHGLKKGSYKSLPRQKTRQQDQQQSRKSRPTSSFSWAGSCDRLSSATDHSGKTVVSARSRSLCTDSLVTPARADAPNAAADVYRFAPPAQEPRIRSDSMEARWSSDNSIEDHRPGEAHTPTYYDSLYSEVSSESSVYGTPRPRQCLVTRGEDHGVISDDEASVDMDSHPRPRRNQPPRRKKSQASRSQEEAGRGTGESRNAPLTPPALPFHPPPPPPSWPTDTSPRPSPSPQEWFPAGDVSRTVGALADSLAAYRTNLV